MAETSPMFRALLKHWRSSRGLSQLDLAGVAEISTRHLSFLETGRASPSREMVLRLGTSLGLSLRDKNELLAAAGLPPAFRETDVAEGFDPPIEDAIARMLRHQEPYPLTVMNRRHDILRMNRAASRLMSHFIAEPSRVEPPMNAMRALFDPAQLRPFVHDWEHVARQMLTTLQREALSQPSHASARELVHELCAFEGVPEDWRNIDLAIITGAVLPFTVQRGDLRLSFVTTLTVFTTSHDTSLEELRIESFFPLDAETERRCAELAQDDG